MSQQNARVLVWSLVLLPCFAFIAYVGWLFRALGDVFITPVAFDEGTWKTLSKCQPASHSRQLSLLKGMDRDNVLKGKTPEEAEQLLGLKKINKMGYCSRSARYRVNDITIQLMLKDGKITESACYTPGPENY